MPASDTKIYYMLYQLTKQYYGIVKHFPKEYKYSLGSETLLLLWECLDATIEANAAPYHDKPAKIARLSSAYEKLKLRIRMSQEINLISIGQFIHIEENFMLEIGKMIGGWQSWSQKSSV